MESNCLFEFACKYLILLLAYLAALWKPREQ